MNRDDKTEKASPHKRMEQRKKGNVFQSKDLISGVMILLSFTALRFLMDYILSRFYTVLDSFISLGKTITDFDTSTAAEFILDMVMNIFVLALPILVIAMVLGIAMSMAQTRMAFTSELLKPKFSRLNPIEGIKKMFSLKALVELLKSILKIVIIIVIVYTVISGRMSEIPALMTLDIKTAVAWLGDIVFTVVLYAGFGMLAIGIIDYFYQWWEHERDLMMSKQEVKDEYKQLEGDPQTKGRIKSIQRKMAQQRMMAGVKDADVVIRNPTHYAVALKLEMDGSETAPVVIAKGLDNVALRIVAEAEKYQIVTTEEPVLARTIYHTVEIGGEIPQNLFYAVADVYAYVYTLNNKFSTAMNNADSSRRY